MAQISAKNFDFWYMDGSLFLQNGYMDGWHFKNPSGTPLPRPKLSTPPGIFRAIAIVIPTTLPPEFYTGYTLNSEGSLFDFKKAGNRQKAGNSHGSMISDISHLDMNLYPRVFKMWNEDLMKRASVFCEWKE